MTVSDLRKALKGLPGDMPIALLQSTGRVDFVLRCRIRGIVRDLSNGLSEPELHEAGVGVDHFVVR